MPPFYDRYVLPRVMDWACGYKKISKIRRDVVPQARGVVVEFGIGSGHNLIHYDPERVACVIGVDPAEHIRSIGKARYLGVPFEVEVVQGVAEDTGLDNAMADTVVVTYTLCSVASVEAALDEARRILKPNGKLLFLEHGLAPCEKIAARQKRWSPWAEKLGGGCHLTRDVEAMISSSGFTFDWLDKRWVKRMPKTSSYQYLGAARPR